MRRSERSILTLRINMSAGCLCYKIAIFFKFSHFILLQYTLPGAKLDSTIRDKWLQRETGGWKHCLHVLENTKIYKQESLCSENNFMNIYILRNQYDIGMSYNEITISLSYSIRINKKQNIKIICKTTLQGKVINWLRVCKWRLYDDKWTSDNDLWAPLIFPQYGDPFEETAPDSISTTQGRPI